MKFRYAKLAILSIILIFSYTAIIIANENEAYSEVVIKIDMPWTFRAYSEPDFSSIAVSVFAPQIINAHYVQYSHYHQTGWVKVHTHIGEVWIYTNANMRYIPLATGLFLQQNDVQEVDILGSQVVRILEGKGDWKLISTWLGERWIYANFVPCTKELDTFFSTWGNNIAVFYKNIETGFVYTYNPYRVFFGASVPKLFHALYVYKLAEKGAIDLHNQHMYTSQDFWGGTGVLLHRAFGEIYTTRELLGYSIRESDNAAQRMLYRYVRNQEFSYADFVYKVGTPHVHFLATGLSVVSQNLTAHAAGIWAQHTLNYLNNPDAQFAHYLHYDLLNPSVGFITADYPVLQKYGWYRHNMHDLAIVQAPSPYILIILTNMGYGGGLHITNTHTSTHDIFISASYVIQNFNTMFFTSANASANHATPMHN